VSAEHEPIEETLRRVASGATPQERENWNRLRLSEVAAQGLDGWLEDSQQIIAEMLATRTGTVPGAPSLPESELIIEPLRRVVQRYLGFNARPQDSIVTTGFPDLDKLMSFEEETFVVVGAHSGHGKSSISMQFAFHVGERFGPSLFFTSEMSSEQLALRLACTLGSVDSKRIKRGLCTSEESGSLSDQVPRVSRALAWITDSPGLDILEIRARARREVKRIEQDTGKKVRLIVVDYLQRVRAGKAAPRDASREQCIHAIAQEMKEMSRELKLCVISPSQLNEDSTKRPDGRPQASDVRESRGIMNEADVVLLVHNSHFQKRMDSDSIDTSKPEACELIVGKGRNDGNGMAHAWFTPLYARFDSMTEDAKRQEREDRMRTSPKRGRS
jgi:replicative DNA helicase